MASDPPTTSERSSLRSAAGDDWIQALLLRHAGATALAVLDADLRFLRVSEDFASLLGLPVDAYLGRSVADLLPDLPVAPYADAVARARAGEEVRGVRIAARVGPDTGVVRHFEVSLHPEAGLDGAVHAVGLVVTDVTERKAVERALEERDATLRLVLDSAPSAMLVVDAAGVVVGRNEEAERLFGYREGELLGHRVEELVPGRYRTGHPELRAAFHRDPRTRSMGHGRDLVARRRDGTEFPVEVGLGVSPERSGLVTCVVTDLTERKRSEAERSALLAEAQAARADAERSQARLAALQHVSDAGLAHLSLDGLLDELLARVVRVFDADVSSVLLLDEAGTSLVPTASIGLEEEVGRASVVPVGSGLAGGVAARRQPVTVDDLAAVEVPGEVLRASGVRSAMAAPLLVDGMLLGVQLVGRCDLRPFDAADAALLRLMADRAALAVQQARAYAREHAIAETLQQSLLPERLPPLEGLRLAVRYRAGAAGTKVGGDWYDVVPLGADRTGFVVGDVMGRGIRAAAVTGQLRHTARVLLRLSPSLEDAAGHLNAIVGGLAADELTTVVLAELDTDQGTLLWLSAGHPPPVVRRVGGTVAPLEQSPNVPLGATETWPFTSRATAVGAGDVVLFYTDGLIERRGSSISEGIDRLVRSVERAGDLPPDELSAAVFRDLLDGGSADDDVALLVCRVEAVGTGSPDLVLPARPASVRAIRDGLGSWLSEVGADGDERHELLLAVTEALNRTAGDAPSPARGEPLWHVTAQLVGDEVRITIGDPRAPAPPGGSDRGRGLVMMEAMVDEVALRRGAAGADVTLSRRLRHPAVTPPGGERSPWG